MPPREEKSQRYWLLITNGMKTTIEAKNTSYAEFNKYGSEAYNIPALQRPYTWEAKHIEKLWNDLLENEPPYYIGSIVLIPGEGTISQDQVIDGQQRLTTISLFLLAIRDYIAGKELEEFFEIDEAISELVVKPRKRLGDQIRLTFYDEKSNDVYKAIVNKTDLGIFELDPQKKFIKNYNYFLKKLKEYIPECELGKIKFLYGRIMSLQLICIRCADNSAAYKLFESINATGVNLATTDMVKNYIFKNLSDDKVLLKEAEDGWKGMLELFNDISLTKTYIRHHWISTNAYTSHANLYDDLSKKYKGKNDLVKYSKSLFEHLNVYNSLRRGDLVGLERLPKRRYEQDETRDTLQFLSFLGVDQIYPVLMSSYIADAIKFRKDLISFTAFQFLYKYIPGSPSVPETKYFANYCAKKITKNEVVNGLMALCENLESQFVEKFLEKTKYASGSSGEIQFVLEKFLQSKGPASKFEKPTIEHVLPQDLTDDIYKGLDLSKKELIQLINSFGNLTVLEMPENSSSNKFNTTFAKKKHLYKRHHFVGNQNILDYSFESDPKYAVQKRGEDVARAVYKIFIQALKTGKWKTE